MKCRLLKKHDVDQLPMDIRPLYANSPPAPLMAAVLPVAPAPVPEPAADRQARLLNRIVGELVRERERLLDETRPELLQISLAVAREIIGHEISIDPGVIDGTLRKCLGELHFASRVVVRLHPDDLAYLRRQPEGEKDQTGEIELMADTSIERGGCLIESDRGGVDATIETQLRLLGQHLRASLSKPPELCEASGT
ncbi:MAG: FliH/SctL family protein [Armatimonadota bacterium]